MPLQPIDLLTTLDPPRTA